MSEELLQTVGIPIGRHTYYKIGSTTLRQLSRKGIIKCPIPNEIKSNRPDGLILLDDGTVKAYVEYKTPIELNTQAKIQKAIDQEIEAARNVSSILIVSDGSQTFWINPHTGKHVEVGPNITLPVFNAEAIVTGAASTEYLQHVEQIIDSANHFLSPTNNKMGDMLPIDPSQLARTIWQKIWINTGKEPEKCLYNVVELLIFKFLSDLAVLGGHNNFTAVHKLSNEAGHDAALTNYAKISRPAIRNLFPAAEDGTTIINGTIFINEAGEPNLTQSRLFCEVLDDLDAYGKKYGSFRYIQRQFKTRLYESFLRQSAGLKHLGQYFTPRNIVQAIVKMSPVNSLAPGASLCDPFCGVGGFLLEAIMGSPTLTEQYVPHNGTIAPKVSVIGYDKGGNEKDDERTIILAKANAIIYFSDLVAKYNAPSHLKEITRKVINPMFNLLRTNLGTLEVTADAKYDLILTNPPYVTSGSSSVKKALVDAGIVNLYPAGGRGVESLAIQWVSNNLKPRGWAFVIVPDGLLNQSSILNYLKRKCVIRAVISLPVRSFYSTPKKTYILSLERKNNDDVEQTDPIFTYLVSEIGETRDANRWEIDENHLVDMTNQFNQFKGSPDTFTSQNSRCKVVPWEEFTGYEHWMVDRYWTIDELKELGMIEETEELTISDFNDLIVQAGGTRLDIPSMNVQYAEVLLGNAELFTLQIGDRVTKKECVDEGIPCISANVTDVFGHIKESNILTNFDVPSLTWGIDGNFDWYLVPSNYPFHPTDHCGVLRVLSDKIDPEYMYYTLRATRDRHGFDRTYRANEANVKRVSVPIPVCNDGTFDLDTQKKIASKHRDVETSRMKAQQLLQQIADARVVVD